MNAFESPSRPAPQLSAIRDHFPILAQTVHGKPLVYLDNAATTQKPLVVLDAMKMDTYVNSSRDGIVASVDCAVGDSVSLGQQLLTLE